MKVKLLFSLLLGLSAGAYAADPQPATSAQAGAPATIQVSGQVKRTYSLSDPSVPTYRVSLLEDAFVPFSSSYMLFAKDARLNSNYAHADYVGWLANQKALFVAVNSKIDKLPDLSSYIHPNCRIYLQTLKKRLDEYVIKTNESLNEEIKSEIQKRYDALEKQVHTLDPELQEQACYLFTQKISEQN